MNGNNEASNKTFKEISEAYQVISEPWERRKYDMCGDNWKYVDRIEESHKAWQNNPSLSTFDRGSSSEFARPSLDAMFDEFLGVTASTMFRRSTEIQMPITLEETFKGTTCQVESPFGSRPNETHRLEVSIPPGVDTGTRIHIPDGKSLHHDFYLRINVLPHSRFQRNGNDLKTELEVPLIDAVLGGEITLPTLKGQLALIIPPETQNNQVFRLTGQGMPHLNNPQVHGNLIAKVKVLVPKDLSQEEIQIFKKLKELRIVRS